MRRHVIVARLGPQDRGLVPRAADEISTDIDLVASRSQLGYGIGHAIDAASQLGIFPSETGLDLLVLALLVYAADTRISRTTESQDTWTREIRLVVPVNNPELWSSVSALLQRMLGFLTGDRWTIGFRPRPYAFATVIPRRPRGAASPSFDGLSLFSGGLDSLIGAINLMEAGRSPLFVSHASDSATSDAQNTCFETLQSHYSGQTCERLRVWASFPEGLVQGSQAEKTTRGRSFVFFGVGSFIGTGFDGTFTLRSPENGFIAINVPLDTLRLGALSTRTTHPFYIARYNELLNTLGIPGRVENPYWDKTKGEMILSCADPKLLTQLVPSTMSCSSPTKARWRGHGVEHCGHCLPCLVRRAAIERALGRGADPTLYTLSDLTEHRLDTRTAEGLQVRSFQIAIDRLKARPQLAQLLIHKAGPLFDESPAKLQSIAGVYERGMHELAGLLAGVRTGPS